MNGPTGTDVRLNLDPWDAFYVVFHPLTGSLQDAVLEATNAESLDSVTRQGKTVNVHVLGPVSTSDTFVELRNGAEIYKGSASNGGAQPLTLGGKWQFRPQPDRVSVPYARVSDAPEVTGGKRGWAASDFDDTDWPEMWLNEEQNTCLLYTSDSWSVRCTRR